MKIEARCGGCTATQIAELIERMGWAPGWELMSRALEVASKATPDTKPIELYRIMFDTLPIPPGSDIYLDEKRAMNRAVLEAEDFIKKLIEASEDPISTAVLLSAVGNVMDIGVAGHRWGGVKEEIERHLREDSFAIDHRDVFKEMLKGASLVLLIADNAGEIVFDRILLETITRHHPDITPKIVVRGEPILSDVTEDDAIHAGVPREWIVNSGVNLPGLVLSRANEETRRLWAQADIIISKGQGNYEGLSEDADHRVFFLLKAKCPVVARSLGVKLGQIVFMRRASG